LNRITQVKRGQNWEVIEFEDLKSGDVFRLVEPSGEVVINSEDGRSEFEAIEEPRWDEHMNTSVVEVKSNI